ncbi:cobaltochelatase subunit CobN, partial [Cupriavidus basilensis]
AADRPRAGWPDALAKLDEVIEQQEAAADSSPALAEQYRLQALAQIRALGLDRQLGLDLGAPWTQVEPVIHRFLHKVEAEPVPLGIHALGELPPPDIQQQALATVLGSAFDAGETRRIGQDTLSRWAGALIEETRAPTPPASAMGSRWRTRRRPRCRWRGSGWRGCANRRAANSTA